MVVLLTLRSNVERCLFSRGDPGRQHAAMQESSTDPGFSTIYPVKWLASSHICISAIFRLVHAQLWPWLLCCYLSLPNPPWVGCRHHNQVHPLQPPAVIITWANLWGIWEGGGWGPHRHKRKKQICKVKNISTPPLFAPTHVSTLMVSPGKWPPEVPIAMITCLSSGVSHGVWARRTHSNSKNGSNGPMLTVSAPNEQSILS